MLKIEAPCKINIDLQIHERRSDGYHNLESIFLALAFGDTLWVDLAEDDGICDIQMDWLIPQDFSEKAKDFPLEKNIIYRAVELFRDRTGFHKGVRIRVAKRIPLGAGLGGGSSDGASTLRALNMLADAALTLQDLQEMAAILGSDVPFFLVGGAAFISGRGEQILPVKMPSELWVVLVYPGFPSSTAEAFSLLDKVRMTEGQKSVLKRKDAYDANIADVLLEHPGRWPYRNDFLPIFLSAGDTAATAYRAIQQALIQSGADFSSLSGSGSTCFGIFTDKKKAEQARKALFRTKNFTELTFPLARSGIGVVE